jgi:hypothetical protein
MPLGSIKRNLAGRPGLVKPARNLLKTLPLLINPCAISRTAKRRLNLNALFLPHPLLFFRY